MLHHMGFPCSNHEEYICYSGLISAVYIYIHDFFFLDLGAIHFFQKMNIGSLKIGDFLGIVIFTLFL